MMRVSALIVLTALALQSCGDNASNVQAPAADAAAAETSVETSSQIKAGNGIANYIELEGVKRDGATFTFRRVRIDRQGWLVMHPFEDGAPVPTVYVGAAPLSAGDHENVEITIDETTESGVMFVVMLHYDMNEDGVFDFNDGVTVPDAPVFEDGVLIALRFAAP
jgi:hypothetical protein